MFHTVIEEATKNGPNFAGRYTIADSGCGTSCESVAVIDAETGAAYFYEWTGSEFKLLRKIPATPEPR